MCLSKNKKKLPPVTNATRIIPHDHKSAGVAS